MNLTEKQLSTLAGLGYDAKKMILYMVIGMIIPLGLPIVWFLSIIGLIRSALICSQPEVKEIKKAIQEGKDLSDELHAEDIESITLFFKRKDAFWYPTIVYVAFILILVALFKLT